MTATIIKFDLTHDLCSGKRWSEIRISPSITIKQLKQKLSTHVGTDPNFMRVQLRQTSPSSDKEDHPICDLTEDTNTLASYLALNDNSEYILHIFDDDPASILRQMDESTSAENLTQKIPDEVYNQRPSNARKFIDELRAKQPELFEQAQARKQERLRKLKETQQRIQISSRCQVKDTSIRGEVVWIGYPSAELLETLRLDFGPVYLGIILDQSHLGNFDGMDGDKKLFDCDDEGGIKKSALLVPEDHVLIGAEFTKLELNQLDEI